MEGGISRLQLWVGLADGKPACAGVEPDVEDVGFLAEVRAAALRAGGIGRKQAGHIGCVPGLRAMILKQFHDLAVERGVQNRLVAAFAQENGDGNAPDPLAADAPVGSRGDHVGDALLAPGRVPDHLVDFFHGKLTEGGFGAVGALDRGLHADEPLLGGAEDHRMVAAPAVRIGVFQVRRGQQRAGLFEHGNDDGIGGPNGFSLEGGRRGVVPGIGVYMHMT